MTTPDLDAETAGDYPADLYHFDRTATYVESIDDVSMADIDRFERDGYLAIRHALTEVEITDILSGLTAVLDRPGEALVQYEAWAADGVERVSADERMDLIRKFMWFVPEDPRLTALARNEKLLGVVRQLCRSDDLSMIQDMALLKPPGGGREKPWHQDNAFFNYEPGTRIVGVWIALDPATPDNGCMHVLPGTHAEGPITHFRRRDWQLCDTDVDRARDTTIPLPPGGALLFHGLIHHGTPPNNSATRRRAVQLHYVPSATPNVPEQRRLDIFGSEGKNVTC